MQIELHTQLTIDQFPIMNNPDVNRYTEIFMVADSSKWECLHCTTVNSMKNNICEVCYRTPGYKLQKNPSLPTHTPVKYCCRCNVANRMKDLNCVVCAVRLI